MFDFHTCSREIINIFPSLNLKKNIGFFSYTIVARSFKLCMIIFITLLEVYIVIQGLMTVTLFQGHRCVRNTKCKFHVLDFCPLWLQHCMVATYIKSSYTKDHIPSPTVHNASVLRTAYEVHAFKKSWQMSHVVCTKQMVLAAFYNLLLVQVYPWNYSLYFRHACCLFSDRPSSACHSLG